MKKYIRIMRLDHWIKQLFILPGVVFAYLLLKPEIKIDIFILKFILGFLGLCFIASANYVINEWLDSEFDKYHPVKKNRSVVTEDVKGHIVWILYVVLSIIGFCLGYFVNFKVLSMELFLFIMGILYNVKPIRTKDVPIIDVLSESVNNAIRLLLGWFIVAPNTIPPCSFIIGYWMSGAYLMAVKRFAEYKMINNPKLAGKYRKSFKYYSEISLLISSFFYAMCAVLFIGIFLIKYRVELILFMPFLIGLFSYYLVLSFKPDSVVQKPEKLYKEKKLMLYCIFLIALFIVLMVVDLPFLDVFVSDNLINI